MAHPDFFAGKTIFLTGGTGFFGKSILDMLLRGAFPRMDWTVLSRDPDGFLRRYPEFAALKQVHFVRGDVKDFSFFRKPFDLILHAATPAVTDMPPGAMRDVILQGTQRVLEFGHLCGAQKILFASSGAVYGAMPQEISAWREDAPCRPVTEYGIAKLEAEAMCRASGIPAVTARCFAFAGPRLNREIHFAIGNFIRNAMRGEPIVIRGDGTPLRSYLYADELVEWLMTILMQGKDGCCYNVGSPDAVSIGELAQIVAQQFSGISVEIQKKHRPGDPVDRYVPDVTRAKEELGLQCRITLAEAIRLTVSAVQSGRG